MKQRRAFAIGGIALVAAIAAIYLAFPQKTRQDSDNIQQNNGSTIPTSEGGGAILGEEADEAARSEDSVHPVSLPALIAKEFSGRDFALGEVLDRNSAYTRYAISYKSGDLTISGIMNLPVGDGPFPVLILNHGYIDPAVYTRGRGLKREQDYLARNGFAVVHIDYRSHAGSTTVDDDPVKLRLGYVEDAVNAIIALKESGISSIDPERVGMLGHSMGGGVSLGAAIVRPDLFDVVVLFAPVHFDMVENYRRWMEHRPNEAAEIQSLYGTPESNPEFWKEASLYPYIGRIDDIVVIHHGTNDADVPVGWSQDLMQRLRDADKNVELYTYEGEPHEFIAAWPRVMQRTKELFSSKL